MNTRWRGGLIAVLFAGLCVLAGAGRAQTVSEPQAAGSAASSASAAPAASVASAPPALTPEQAAKAEAAKAEEALREHQLLMGIQQLQAGKPAQAINESFDKVIAAYEAQYHDAASNERGIVTYSTRTQTETVYYMLLAATRRVNARAIGATWGDAWYLKAYALIELKRFEEARAAINQALKLSPKNAKYLSESANLHATEREWTLSLQGFRAAESAAQEFSPPDLKNAELSRAWRGLGYALIELKRFDEAEAQYRKCLALDPNDAKAKGELGYIASMRAKATTP